MRGLAGGSQSLHGYLNCTASRRELDSARGQLEALERLKADHVDRTASQEEQYGAEELNRLMHINTHHELASVQVSFA